MGLYTQCVVDRETDSLEDARRLGQQIIAWLVEVGIIENQLTDCALVEPGYPPGPHYWKACDLLERYLPGTAHDGLLTLRTNGVQVFMDRYPFYIAQGDNGPARCPHCEAEKDLDTYYEAGGEWFEGGAGDLRCEACGEEAKVIRWKHDNLLFGTLGLVFWNWPSLSPGFLRELSERIGRSVSVIEGKA